ncbi:dihydrodipicolinate synthetase [Sodiomyces alkalinus F11]|uniref:Dihydrodipicolinate synthetase n=1 Tax=Sodiomyces alkalinus (strain CBS 110278 / VKM F-3762 / F11) TaxID=1314773 RepID=A0A3N2PPU3_SODAK|nr:dihydrodipicolinate synthetase [Sodiomyces alkalinus F11]ROT36533.1 dihydrodipicolinate synthetase [Sodiomyces alkalinus F11]
MSPSATGSNPAPPFLDGHSTLTPTSAQPTASRPLTPGIYVPTVAFFRSDDSIDVETTASHATRLARSGVAGLVTHGSNGEAVHLDHAERQLINRITRDALDAAGNSHIPLIVGCGAQSTREAIQLCEEAAASGGNYTLVLPPAYYGNLLSTELIIRHFRAVADASPIPVLVYNFPGACSGLDLSSDVIIALSNHPNVVGVKLTCGNTGKLARIAAATATPCPTASSKKTTPSIRADRATATTAQQPFRTFGGSVDFTLQTLVVGGHGIIGGTANIAPRACIRLVELWEQGKLAEARELQAVVARGDWTAIQGGFVSVKAALAEFYGYGGEPRKPCALLEGDKLKEQLDGFAELVETERALEKLQS